MSLPVRLAAAAVVAAAPLYASAATILIDDFSDTSRVADLPSGGVSNVGEFAAPTAIGGWRDLFVDTTLAEEDATDLRTTGGILSFSNISQASGAGVVTYDGNDGDGSPGAVDFTGLGGVDFLAVGPDPRFLFDVVDLDADLTFGFEVFDTSGASSFFDIVVPEEVIATGPTLFLPLSVFTGVDLTSVGALQFSVTGPQDADGSISRIVVAPIPLPPSMLLLAGAMAGFGLLRRRRSV